MAVQHERHNKLHLGQLEYGLKHRLGRHAGPHECRGVDGCHLHPLRHLAAGQQGPKCCLGFHVLHGGRECWHLVVVEDWTYRRTGATGGLGRSWPAWAAQGERLGLAVQIARLKLPSWQWITAITTGTNLEKNRGMSKRHASGFRCQHLGNPEHPDPEYPSLPRRLFGSGPFALS